MSLEEERSRIGTRLSYNDFELNRRKEKRTIDLKEEIYGEETWTKLREEKSTKHKESYSNIMKRYTNTTNFEKIGDRILFNDTMLKKKRKLHKTMIRPELIQ